MHVRTAASSIAALVLSCQLVGPVAGADDLPLPERNPLRVLAMPLPERNPERTEPEREAALSLPERNPLRVVPEPVEPQSKQRGQSPGTIPRTPQADILKSWSADETAAERARCVAVLKDLEAEVEPASPMRNGACGSAAPYKLSRIGKDPEVRVVPPATVTCDMVASLVRWIEQDVQPTARRILGAPLVRINGVSDYSCRNALSRTSTRLSEHALANALDIRDFVTAKGESADLKRDWGPTARDIAARVAAEKAAEAARRAAEAAAKAARTSPDSRGKIAKAGDNDKAPPRTAKDGGDEAVPPLTVAGEASGSMTGRRLSRAEVRRARREARRMKVASRLGGPAVAAGEGVLASRSPQLPTARQGNRSKRGAPSPKIPALPVAEKEASPRRQFLREIHAKACERFGTVLGPEANEAHRDHFHVDMAKRRYRSFCE